MKSLTTLVVLTLILTLLGGQTTAAPKQQPKKAKTATGEKAAKTANRKSPGVDTPENGTSANPVRQTAKGEGNGWQKEEFISIPGMSFHTAVWNKDGTSMLVIGKDIVHMFTKMNGKMSQQFVLEHKGLVTGVVFSPQEKHIITSSYDKSIKIWDAQTGQLVREERMTAWMGCAFFSEDSQWMFSVSSRRDFKEPPPTVFYWRMENDLPSKQYGTCHHGEDNATVSMDTATGIITTSGKTMVKKWAVGNPQPMAAVPAPADKYKRMVTSKNPRKVLTVVTYDRDPAMYVLNESGNIPFVMPKGVNLKEDSTAVFEVEISPSGDAIVAEYIYRKKVAPNKRTGEKGGKQLTQELFVWKDPLKPPRPLITDQRSKFSRILISYKFLDDGSLLTTSHDGRFIIWDMRTLKPTQTLQFENLEQHLGDFSFSPNGQKIAIIIERAGVLLLEKK